MNQPWLDEFLEQTRAEVSEPFALCLSAAVAAVESGWGERAIHKDGLLNEIGYKAVAGQPSLNVATREASQTGKLSPTRAAFRLFADRRAQARSLVYLLRSSVFFEAARLLYVLTFYAAYAPGRVEGARQLLSVFNQLACSGRFAGVRPFQLPTGRAEEDVAALNHAAARQGVQIFAQLCSVDPKGGKS